MSKLHFYINKKKSYFKIKYINIYLLSKRGRTGRDTIHSPVCNLVDGCSDISLMIMETTENVQTH